MPSSELLTGGGGPAAQRGLAFQNRTAAWVAVQILGEQAVSPPWGLPVNTTLEFVLCETTEAVDDLLIGTSDDGHIFISVKRSLFLERGEHSDLASVVDQFVRQFHVGARVPSADDPERPLDADRDRLVILVGPASSAPIREHLPKVLRRVSARGRDQPIKAAARNKEEARVLGVFLQHLVRSWRRVWGSDPCDHELRELLSLVRVFTLDVDEGGDAEREAKHLLRSSVLADPTQDDVAWDRLVQACTMFTSDQTGADRRALQQVLLHAGLYLQAPRSYRADIERLKGYSRRTASLLSVHSKIQVGATEVRIDRPSTQALRQAAEKGSLLVVGEPGAGKSAALHDLAAALQKQGRDVVFLAVDRLEASALGALRNELGLSYELLDILENWHGEEPACLVVDALDAARSEGSVKTVSDLIAQTMKLESRWRVIASVRKFDLRYSRNLRQIFAGTLPSKFVDTEFLGVRHINVPTLEDEELDQVRVQSPELASLIQRAGPALHGLIRVPFNLRLLGELLGEGVVVEELRPIRAQIELLDRYWLERVVGDNGLGDAREAVLRRVVDEMIQSRALRANRPSVAQSISASAVLRDLLSSRLLSEWQPSPEVKPYRYVLTFAHNILFDYAVERLWLRGAPEPLVGRLGRDPTLVLVIRPSLVFHFQHAWFSDPTRTFFWKLALEAIRSREMTEIGKLIGPAVAADLANQLADFTPLLAALGCSDSLQPEAAEQAFRHVIGAAVALSSEPNVALAGQGAGPWAELLERISHLLRTNVAYPVRMLLSHICDHPEVLTTAQRHDVGACARRLLEFAWGQAKRDGWLVIHALQAVCRTFESDRAASAGLIRRCLEAAHLAEHGYEELPWLAREIGCLIPIDPDLAEEIYRAAFSYREESQDRTLMVSSGILPLTSTRPQDYDMGLYVLAETYPQFLSFAPAHATRALIVAMEDYVSRRHPPASGEVIEETFDFEGREARIRTDYSSIWDRGDTYRHDEPLKMLDAFESRLREIAQDPQRVIERREILSAIVARNRLAALWRRLLIVGAEAPRTLGKNVRSLAWAIPVLTYIDTTVTVGDFLHAGFGHFDLQDRSRIERAILSIPTSKSKGRYESDDRSRNRLLGCLSRHHLVTDEAKRLFDELTEAGNIPANEPFFGSTKVTWAGTYDEKEYLADEGVPVDAEPNRGIQALQAPIKAFAERHRNSSPTPEDIEAILPALRFLRDALRTAEVDGVHPKQRDYGWGTLSEACERITSCKDLTCETEAGAFIRSVLLQVANHTDPAHHPERDAQFDEAPGWGTPAPRIEAAAGLTWLARKPTCADDAVLGAILRLSQDPAPEVRFQVAERLLALYSTNPELMWSILEHSSEGEASRGVLQALLGPLRRLAGPHQEKVISLAKAIYDRVTDGSGAKVVRESCVSIFLDLYLRHDNPVCRQMVFQIACIPADLPDEAQRIVLNASQWLAHGPVDPSDPIQDAARRRALDLVAAVLEETRSSSSKLERGHQDVRFESWNQAEQDQAQALARLAETMSWQIYFASGAFEERRQEGGRGRVLSEKEKLRFLREVAPLIEELAWFGFPSLIHHLIETLESLVPADPGAVFLLAARVLRDGERRGYQYESLGVKLIVALVERYLADHRAVLRESQECQRALLEILDSFVRAGWPDARRLTYRLEELFR